MDYGRPPLLEGLAMFIKAWGSPSYPNIDGPLRAIPTDLFERYPFVVITVAPVKPDISRIQLLFQEESPKIGTLSAA